MRLLRPLLPLLMATLLLAGCAGPHLVESDVTSYSHLTALPSPPNYRIERLPSQQEQAKTWVPIEAQAEQALARVGLQRGDAQPSLLVQLGAVGNRTLPRDWPYYGDGPFAGSFGWRMGWHHRGMGLGWMMDMPPTLYHREVSIVLRDAATRQVVYESSATYEDVWTEDPLIYGVLFDQALSGFPQPPSGARKVRTEVMPTAR